jgi:hypothetical protein
MDLKNYIFSMEEGRDYLEENGLGRLCAVGQSQELPPKLDDLARLYRLVRDRMPFQVLEFGSGFSTVVMAEALKRNWEEYLARIQAEGRSRVFGPPRCVSVESSEKWRENTWAKIEKAGLADFSEVVFSRVSMGEHNGQVCHFYDDLPDVVPDFVYLDGPDPSTVEGSVNGLSFKNPARTVMSGDILKYESTLLPGFFMIVDGRTNNARFLERMLTRTYDVAWSPEADITVFELNEPRLGKKNVSGPEAYGGQC